MNKLLTVSIAAYNMEKFLSESISNFLKAEKLDMIEILIINDGSKDRTSQIAKEYEKKYPNSIKLIDKENGGWGSTVNYGIKYATGKYFKLLDADDYYCNIDKFLDVLNQSNADLVYTNYHTFYDESDKQEKDSVFPEFTPINKEVEIKADYFPSLVAMHSCTFKTELIKNKFSITENCFYTDTEFVLKAIKYVKTVYFWDKSVYWYRIGREGQSASVEGCRKHYLEHLKVLYGLLKEYEMLDSNIEIKEIYRRRLMDMVDMQYGIFLLLKPDKGKAKLLKKFDTTIRKDYKRFYDTKRRRIRLFRILGEWSYGFLVYK